MNLLNPTSMESARQIETIFLDPLPGYDDNDLKKVWVYEQANPLPATAKACEATSLFPIVISKNREVIIRDKRSKKVLIAIYRNRIGPDALQIMRDTLIEMMDTRRKIARPGHIKQYNQGAMTAAGYLS